MWEKCGELKGFIIPYGKEDSCIAHIARSVCRRAERKLARFYQKNKWISQVAIKYINRLSDYLFALARYLNLLNRVKEEYAKL